MMCRLLKQQYYEILVTVFSKDKNILMAKFFWGGSEECLENVLKGKLIKYLVDLIKYPI